MRLSLELDGQEAEEIITLIRELKEVLEDVREDLRVYKMQQDSGQGGKQQLSSVRIGAVTRTKHIKRRWNTKRVVARGIP